MALRNAQKPKAIAILCGVDASRRARVENNVTFPSIIQFILLPGTGIRRMKFRTVKHSLCILLYTLLLLSSVACAQGLEEIFLALPDSAVLNLSKSDRQLLWKKAKLNVPVNEAVQHQDPKLQLAIHDLDIKNGYLGVAGNSFEGDYRLCYWNLPEGKKLIAAYEESYATFAAVESFAFYVYGPDKTVTYVAMKDLIPPVENALFRGDAAQVRQELEEKDINVAILYDLPRRGKDIIARISADMTTAQIKPYFHGNRLQIVWDNGKFRIGKVYWE